MTKTELISERFIDVDGIKIFCRSAGKGRPVLLLHGLGASSYSWRSLLPLLAPRYAVCAFDWPGSGRSQQPEDFDYSPDGYARFLLRLMDRLEVERAHLIGNSLGGLIALWTVLHSPQRISHLALIGTPVYPRNKPKLLWPLRWPVIGAIYERCLGEWAVKIVAKSALQDHSIITPELLEEYGMALRTRQGKRAVAQFIRNAVPADTGALISRYKDIRNPTLVVVGETDGVVAPADARRFAGEVPGARFFLVKGAGHAPQEEKPDVVAESLLSFLSPPGSKFPS